MDYIRGLQLQVTVVAATNMNVEPVTAVQPDDYINVDGDPATEDDGGDGNERHSNIPNEFVNVDGVPATYDDVADGIDSINVDVHPATEDTTQGDLKIDDHGVGADVDFGIGLDVPAMGTDGGSGYGDGGVGASVDVAGDGGGPGIQEDADVKDEVSQKFDRHHIESDIKSIKSTVGGIEERVGDVEVSILLSELDIVKKRVGVIEDLLGVRFDKSEDVHADTPSFVVRNDKSEDVHADTPSLEVCQDNTHDVVCDNKV